MLPPRRHEISRLEAFSTGPAHRVYGVRSGGRRKSLEARLAAETAAAVSA